MWGPSTMIKCSGRGSPVRTPAWRCVRRSTLSVLGALSSMYELNPAAASGQALA